MTVHDVAATLPAIPDLLKLCRSIAIAEAVLNPGDYRYYTFGAAWSETEEVFAMRNGAGTSSTSCSRPPVCTYAASTTSHR